MSPERRAYYKKKLEDLIAELNADLAQDDGAAEVVKLDTSIGRLSRMDAMQSQQMALELQRRQKNAILRAENSLKRIDQGTYGVCGRCKKPISEDRMEAQPDSAFCVPCLDRG